MAETIISDCIAQKNGTRKKNKTVPIVIHQGTSFEDVCSKLSDKHMLLSQKWRVMYPKLYRLICLTIYCKVTHFLKPNILKRYGVVLIINGWNFLLQFRYNLIILIYLFQVDNHPLNFNCIQHINI